MAPVHIVLPNKLSVEKTSDFRSEINRMLEKGEKDFIIDFSKCDFIDSTGLGVLVSIYKKCSDNGGSIKLCEINNPQVYKIFQLTRLDKIFDIYSSYEEIVE